ncbi:MAG: hypothetical protein LIO58_04085, partial [Oscillospiraceae bacterium]|nr:hypothetical protein [Oscillospiraceae bacterium]
ADLPVPVPAYHLPHSFYFLQVWLTYTFLLKTGRINFFMIGRPHNPEVVGSNPAPASKKAPYFIISSKYGQTKDKAGITASSSGARKAYPAQEREEIT